MQYARTDHDDAEEKDSGRMHTQVHAYQVAVNASEDIQRGKSNSEHTKTMENKE